MPTPSDSYRKGSVPRGAFARVIHAYLASAKFLALEPATQQSYRRHLMLAADPTTLGGLDVHDLRASITQRFLDGLAATPGKQTVMLAVLKAVEKWAVVRDMVPSAYTTGCTAIESDGGHEPWTDLQVEIAEQHAAPAFSRVVTLAANTGQRGSDLCRMHPNDLEELEDAQGIRRLGINVRQKKTGKRIWIPLTQQLIAVMETWPRTAQPFLLKPDGSPWTRPDLSREWSRERERNPKLAPCAGLVLHGLRATACVRLKRAGASELQIADMVGMSTQMVGHYTRFADQRQNALAALHFLDRTSQERGGTNVPSTPLRKPLKS